MGATRRLADVVRAFFPFALQKDAPPTKRRGRKQIQEFVLDRTDLLMERFANAAPQTGAPWTTPCRSAVEFHATGGSDGMRNEG